MTDKERILQEIERLETPIEYELIEARAFECALELVKKIIGSLPAETASPELEKEIQIYDNYLEENGLTASLEAIAHHFAEWQKQQMLKGKEEVVVVDDWQYGKDTDGAKPAIKVRNPDWKIGDKKRVIILKEDIN